MNSSAGIPGTYSETPAWKRWLWWPLLGALVGLFAGVLIGVITAWIGYTFFPSRNEHAFIQWDFFSASVLLAVVFGMWGGLAGFILGVIWAMPRRVRWTFVIGTAAGALLGACLYSAIRSDFGNRNPFDFIGADDDVAFPILGAVVGAMAAIVWCLFCRRKRTPG